MFQEAKNLIEKYQNICIFLPEKHELALTEGDVFCAGIALFYTLEKLGKKTSLFFEKVPKRFHFISSNESVISIKTKDVDELSYEKDQDGLKIFLTSAKGQISPKEVSFIPRDSFQNCQEEPELIIVLGAKNLEEVGRNFSKNPEVFYKTPILNIDNRTFNENFGEVNLVEIKSCSLCEVVFDLIKELDESLIDKNISTALLTGIVWASENFRTARTRPETFKKASSLIKGGADHQKIIQHLYKTKTLAQIKLLGKVLERLTFNSEKELYYTKLTEKDFKEHNATSKDLAEVLQELKFNFGNQIFANLLLLWESHNSPPVIKGVFYSFQENLIEKVLKRFEGTSRGKTALFSIREESLDKAYQKFLESI